MLIEGLLPPGAGITHGSRGCQRRTAAKRNEYKVVPKIVPFIDGWPTSDYGETRMHRVVWWAPLALLLGCADKPPPLTLKVAHGAGPEGRCFPPGARPSDESLTAAHVDLL